MRIDDSEEKYIEEKKKRVPEFSLWGGKGVGWWIPWLALASKHFEN